MSTETRSENGTAARIEDFEHLYPRQVTHTSYRVLNLKGDGTNTAYLVDLRDLTCDCPDYKMRREQSDGPELCKHLATALYQAETHISTEREAVRYLSRYVRDAHETLERMEESVDGDSTQDQAADDSDSSESESHRDWVTLTESWLHQQGVDIDKVDIWHEDEMGSIQIEANDRLEDHEFEVLSGTDWIWYDGDNNRNYITEDNREKVVA